MLWKFLPQNITGAAWKNSQGQTPPDMYDFFPVNNGMNQLAIPQNYWVYFPDFEGWTIKKKDTFLNQQKEYGF